MRPSVLGPDLGTEVHPVEHERAEREHRLADVVALPDVPGLLRRVDEIVDEAIDALGPGRAEELDLGVWEIGLGEDPVPDCVVDVVVDVRDPIDDADDLALERLGLLHARMREDAVAHLVVRLSRRAIRSDCSL